VGGGERERECVCARGTDKEETERVVCDSVRETDRHTDRQTDREVGGGRGGGKQMGRGAG
jgi:hypothetical protein